MYFFLQFMQIFCLTFQFFKGGADCGQVVETKQRKTA